MRRNFSYSGSLSKQETISGFAYLLFEIFLLPGILTWVNARMDHALNSAELNFVFYMINFIAILVIFHDFLSHALTEVFQHPILFCEAVILGFVAYYAMNWATTKLVGLLVPGFSNYNDQAISGMLGTNRLLMLIGTVVLVPPVEESLFRGLIFRNLYGKSRWAAYIVSILAFAIIHIIGYIGSYSAIELLMAFLQYLPAGLCLAWAYIRGGTVFAPIVIHAAINYISIQHLI